MTGAARLLAHPEAANGLRRAQLPLVLIADPDRRATRRLVGQLAGNGLAASVSADGPDALLQAGALHPDAVLVSARLPLLDTVAVVRAIRRRLRTPILLGVGPGDAGTVLDALTAGATACVARPYRIDEVLPLVAARARAGAGDAPPVVVQAGALRVDRAAHEVRLYGRVVAMPHKELELLAYLVRHAGRALSHEEIRANVWGVDYTGGTNTVVVHVRRLRARLGDAVGDPRILLTVRGVGYRLVAPPG